MTTIIDALADAAVETVELYKQHMQNGRYTDASECLGAITGITGQVQRIEDNDIRVESQADLYQVNVGAAKSFVEDLNDLR